MNEHDRNDLRRRLDESHAHLMALLENTDDYILVSDKNARPVLFNTAYARIIKKALGIEMKPGIQPHTLLPDPEAVAWWEGLHRRVLGGEKYRADYTHDFGQGDVRHIEVSFTPIVKEGEIVGFTEVSRDITGRVRDAEALREKDDILSNVFDALPMGVHLYQLQPDDRLVFIGANPAADRILGVDNRQFIGKDILEAFPPLADTPVPDRYREVCRTGETWHNEHIDYEHGEIAGAFDVHAFRTGPSSMAALFLDVTERRRSEREVQKMQKLESVGVLAGGIAHDFNNLLTGILGNILLARTALPEDSEAAAQLVDSEKATEAARQLTQQLLTFSQGGSPVRRTMEIGKVLEDASRLMLSGSNVHRRLSLADDLWPVEIDEGQISQVFHNLTRNADQAMAEGGVLKIEARNTNLDTSVAVPLPPGRYVAIEFQDEGEGMPPAILTRIFDPYFSSRPNGMGSGLGLAIAHSVVKGHKGAITVSSRLGRGSTFTVYLPAAGQPVKEEAAREEEPKFASGRILLVDDEPNVRIVGSRILRHLGLEVEVASDGAEAIEMYREALGAGKPIDAVIMDLTIPGGMGGRDAVRELLALDPGAKVIVSSGYAKDSIMAEFHNYGFVATLPKPYTILDLQLVLSKVL